MRRVDEQSALLYRHALEVKRLGNVGNVLEVGRVRGAAHGVAGVCDAFGDNIAVDGLGYGLHRRRYDLLRK